MQDQNKGTLYIVATPIGNIEDITMRALRVLKEVDLIAAEDTRRTGILLARLGVKKPLISANQYNEESRASLLIERLNAGESAALVTDAGTPAVSDPGARIVKKCVEHGISCVPIPGPSALICALSASGTDANTFVFEGFLPATGGDRKKRLERLCSEPRAFILYEAPHRLKKTLNDLLSALGDRELVIARELTKIYEEIYRTTLSEAVKKYSEEQPLGEFVLIFEPASQKTADKDTDKHASEYMKTLLLGGMRRKEAAALVSQRFGITKRDAYNMELDV